LRIPATAACALGLFSALALGAGESPTPDPKPELSDLRREMLSEYRLAPAGATSAALPSSLHSDSAPLPTPLLERSKDAVQMSPVMVNGAPIAELEGVSSNPDAGRTTVSSKLGLGLKRMKVGKVHVFMYRIFYIPYIIGIEW